MHLEEIRKENIYAEKRELGKNFLWLMAAIIALYSLMFVFYIKDHLLSYYTAIASFSIILAWYFCHNKIKLEKLVLSYLIIAPLLIFYIILRFWDVSAVSFIWLSPIPFVAYVFFDKKVVYYFILYIGIVIISSFVVTGLVDFDFPIEPLAKVKVSDTFLIIANVLIISFLVYYKSKIRELEFINEVEIKEKVSLPVSFPDKDVIVFNTIFLSIENYVLHQENFKKCHLTVSDVSSYLHINNSYIAKSIKLNGFSNFNHYLNTIRINHVKQLLLSKDMNKLTLLYVYSDAGFLSQTTFNRVFKQIEGLTPSEFLKNKVDLH